MAGARQPIELGIAKGRKHFTKADILKRLSEEPKVPYINILAPSELSKKEKAEFYDIAYKLLDIGIFTELDEDTLARYINAKSLYLAYQKKVKTALKGGKIEEINALINTQDKLFRQVRSAAADLGLTITSRCKIVIPKAEEDDDL